MPLFAVTGLSLWGSIVAVSLVCTFYTTLVSTIYLFVGEGAAHALDKWS